MKVLNVMLTTYGGFISVHTNDNYMNISFPSKSIMCTLFNMFVTKILTAFFSG